MNTTIKGLFTAMAFVAAAGCSDAMPTTPSAMLPEAAAQAAPPARLAFSSTQSYTDQQAFSATGGAGSIDFTGSMTTGTPCYDVTGAVQSAPGVVELTVSASPTGGACIQVLTFNNYQGEVTRLSPGVYTFTVVHESGSSTQTVFTDVVTVS